MRQLIWKEWQEQAWKLAFGCIVLGAFAFIGLRTRIIPDDEMLLWVCFPAIGLLPLLTAIGLVPTERGEGTFETLAALPVSMRKVVWLKLAAGLLLCVTPLLLAMLISVAVFGGREMSASAMIALFMRSILSSVALFVWMFAATIRLPTEPRAAMVAIGVLLFWLMATSGLAEAHYFRLSIISPLSFSFEGVRAAAGYEQEHPSLAANLLAGAVIVAALCGWAVRSVSKEPAAGA